MLFIFKRETFATDQAGPPCGRSCGPGREGKVKV
jgi:hypothetical protein